VQVKKLIRTVQTEFPALASVKPRLQIRVGHLFHHPHERDFRLFRHLDIDAPVALDIGANRGQSLMSLWVTCRDPRITAFEPISGLAQKLRDSTPPGLVHVEQVALSHEPGEALIHIPVYNGYVYDGLASLSEDDARWLDEDRVYRYRPDKLEIVTETVEIRTLDSFDLDPQRAFFDDIAGIGMHGQNFTGRFRLDLDGRLRLDDTGRLDTDFDIHRLDRDRIIQRRRCLLRLLAAHKDHCGKQYPEIHTTEVSEQSLGDAVTNGHGVAVWHPTKQPRRAG
jgi:FkbM family methyltransferase